MKHNEPFPHSSTIGEARSEFTPYSIDWTAAGKLLAGNNDIEPGIKRHR